MNDQLKTFDSRPLLKRAKVAMSFYGATLLAAILVVALVVLETKGSDMFDLLQSYGLYIMVLLGGGSALVTLDDIRTKPLLAARRAADAQAPTAAPPAQE